MEGELARGTVLGDGLARLRVPLPLTARSAAPADPEVVRKRSATWFLVLCGLATGLPWLVLPFFGTGAGTTALDLRRLAYVVGPVHVISTFGLYADPALRPLFREHRWRFAYLPMIALAVTPLYFWLATPRMAAIGFLFAGGWATFHFSRQNVGVLAFVYKARGARPPEAGERPLLYLVGVSGVLAVLASSEQLAPAGLGGLEPVLRALAIVGSAAAVAMAAPILWRLRGDWVSSLFLVESVLFFTPLFVMTVPAALPYAAAHGLQYLVFMGFLVLHRPEGRRQPRWSLVAATVAVALGGGLVARWLRHSSDDVVISIIVAVSVAHYLMDASLWRLREPFQRAYVGERFRFLR